MSADKRRKSRKELISNIEKTVWDDISEKTGIGMGNYEIKELYLDTIKEEEQIRQDYDEEGIKELAESIKSQGLIQPIEVMKEGDKYRIISGHRRYRAFKLLNYEKIPAIVKLGIKKEDIPVRQLIENIQREDLDPIEEAVALKKIMEIKGINQEELAKILGKSKSKISKSLSVLRLLKKVSHAKLRGLPFETLYELTTIEDKDTLEKAIELARSGTSRPKLKEMLKEMENQEKRRKRRKKEISQVLSEIYSVIDSVNEKVLKFKIKYGKELTPEDQENIRKQLEKKMKELLKITSTLFEGRATIDVQLTITKSMEELPFPGTSTIVNISNNLVSINYSFIDYSTSASKEEIIEIISQKLPNLQKEVLENSTREEIIDYWNALPFMKISQNVEGFFYKALKEKYKLPRKYLELKVKALENLREQDAQKIVKEKGYTFE